MSISKEQAAAIVARIMADLSDRAGFDVCDVDDTTIDEWRERWIEIVMSGATSPALSLESARVAAPISPERSRDPDDVRVVHRESIPILRVHKAQRIIASQDTPSMCIVASEELDSRKTFGPALGSADLPHARVFYAKEASSIFGALVESLPGGTIDALLVRMLEHKRSLFVVSHDAIAKEG